MSALAWAGPVMRIGYAGRGMVYFAVAGFSLYSIWHGGQAHGTKSALAQLEQTAWGDLFLAAIGIGMLAFSVWRAVDAIYDLEDRQSQTTGYVAKAGLTASALVHLSLALLAFSLVFSGSSGNGSSLSRWLATVMHWPGGRWLTGLGGLIVVAAGLYLTAKGWKGRYRDHLRANPVTMYWNLLLKAGVVAHGLVVAVIGILFIQAAWRANPNEAGGSERAFAWLTEQPYGQLLVGLICLGLLCFSLFCFVNALYRFIPKVDEPNIESLAARLRLSSS